MPIDIAALSPQAKARYIKVGARYGSEDTLAQADATLEALKAHAAALVKTGFGAADHQRLTDARDGLLAAGVQRTSAKAGKTQQRAAHGATVGTGKTERASARSILGGARRDLLEASDPASDAAVKLIDAALATTSSSGGDVTELGNQLALLRDTLNNPTVAAAAAARGGPDAVQALTAALQSLQGSSKPAKRGTPDETERLNLLDGIIVDLARSARKAARVAARKAGTPACGRSPRSAEIGHELGLARVVDVGFVRDATRRKEKGPGCTLSPRAGGRGSPDGREALTKFG